MRKIIPILSIIIAAIAVIAAIFGLIATTAVKPNAGAVLIMLVTVPVVIVTASVSGVSALITFFFRRDILCRIAFFINVGAFVLSMTSIILWQAM